ncbi:MAG: hypothetical protein WCF17_15945 [Terracidiphilus sp.]
MPEIRIPQVELRAKSESPATEPPAGGPAESEVRKYLLSRGNSAGTDRVFHWLMVLCGLSIFGIVALIVFELVLQSKLSLHTCGRFFFTADHDPITGEPIYWDPVNGHFSALPFNYGSLALIVAAVSLVRYVTSRGVLKGAS